MTSITELRRTLDQHAHDVHDEAATGRALDVHARVRRVRQRRVAAVAGAAVVAVVAVGSLVLLPSDREPLPSDRELIGQEAPETIESLGYTYAFARGVESGQDAQASVRLPRSDGPRLITWAADADEVSLDTPYGERTSSDGTEFDDFAIVEGVESGRWSVRAGGADAAIAVYELTDDLPAGIEQDGVLFREEVGEERLVDAAFTEPGDTELTFRVTLPEGDLRLAELCSGVPKDMWVNLSVDGDAGSGSKGCDDPLFDPADGSAALFDEGQAGEPGETVEFRVWLSSDEFRGEPAARAPGARLAVALYAVGEPAAVVAGWPADPVVEHEGHRWGFVETVTSSTAEDRLEYRNDGDRRVLLVGSYRRLGRASLLLEVPGGGFERILGGLGASDLRELLEPGGTATVRVRARGAEVPAGASFGLAVYERID